MDRAIRRLALALAIVGSTACGLSQERGAPPSVDDVIAGLRTLEERLLGRNELYLRYERVAAVDPIPSIASGGMLPAEWIVARKGDMWYVSRRFTQPKRTDTIAIDDKPFVVVARDGFLLDWTQTDQSAVLGPFDLGRNVYSGLDYTRNLSLNAPLVIAKTSGIGDRFAEVRSKFADYVDLPFLPAFLEDNRGRYSYLEEPEEVLGSKCYVLEWEGRDRLWIDPAKGNFVVRRRFSWGEGKPAMWEFTHSDFQEVEPGFWLPFSQDCLRYASIVAERPALWGKVTSQTTYRLHEVRFEVPDDLFEIRLEPGTRVLDTVRKMRYTVQGEAEVAPFAEALKFVSQQEGRGVNWWVVVNIVIVLALLAVVGFRYMRVH